MDKQTTDEGTDKCGIRRLGSNIVLFAIGSFASKFMGYFLLPFYTSILSTEEYGIYDLVITTVNLISSHIYTAPERGRYPFCLR